MRMIIKNKKTGKSYSVITKDSKVKDFYIHKGDFNEYDEFQEYYKPIITKIAKKANVDPKDIAINFSNVEVYNDGHDLKFQSEEEKKAYPMGWCSKEQWEEFTKKYEDWTDWEDVIVGSVLEYESDLRVKQESLKDGDVVEEVVKEEKIEDKKATLTDEEIEQVKELLGLLPDLKALVEDHSAKDDEEKEEEAEEEQEAEEEVQDEESDDVLLESEEDEEELIDSEEEIVSEEDLEEIHDSKASIGAIERNVTDSVYDNELDVADSFDKRYKTQLKK